MSDLVDFSQENAVRDRYSKAAQSREQALCCPLDYDSRYREAIPAEVIERDYGCGDPSRYLRPGETVLDLGSGTGKICFIASQVVGPDGKVIGVDMTDDMLEVARRAAPQVADRIGYCNVSFRKGRIQDLKLDLDSLDRSLSERPIGDANQYLAVEREIERLRAQEPMIADDSIDAIVSDCVLNLVDADKKRSMFAELHRVLKVGGRAIISDIVSDQPVTSAMKQDPALWSGCLSGAMTESEFVRAFEAAGFFGIRFAKYDTEPWRIIDGIVFRSVTIEAFKVGEENEDGEGCEAIYLGPYRSVVDDRGVSWNRGQRRALSTSSLARLEEGAMRDDFVFSNGATGVASNGFRKLEHSSAPEAFGEWRSRESCC